MTKKKVLVHSNFCKAFTGFGKHKKNILRYLFNTGKYEIFELANGYHKYAPELSSMPWKTYGSLPNPQECVEIFKDPHKQRLAGYGAYGIDDIINTVRPDVYMGIEDIWAFDGFYEKPWWNKVNSMVWTTLDSLPILQSAIDAAPKIKNYYVWASFAEKAMKQMGYDHIKTLRGSLDDQQFFRLSDEYRKNLRERFHLQDSFVIGFVFRNQLRKSVPNLLEAFRIFKKSHPNAKLLLHTHWGEGWNIVDLIKEKGLNHQDILTTYFCKKCKNYLISHYVGEGVNCPICGGEKTAGTTNIVDGVNEVQLNEIYNLMDVYCHPFTSGGQEIPIQEAKLTELITLVTNYSCGEDYCTEESGGLPLNWAEYREPGTQFIKASTDPDHIAEQLLAVYNMPSIERAAIGIKARQFVVDYCSIEAIGKELESLIDSMPEVDYDFDNPPSRFNADHKPNFEADEKDFIISLHKEMLGESVDENHTSFKVWKNKLQQEINREQMHNHFRNVCLQQQQKPVEFESILDKDDEGRRICVLAQGTESDILLLNGLMENLHKQYPQHNIYFVTRQEYFPLIEDNRFVHKCILYSEMLENSFILEGAGAHKGYFDLAFMPTTTTQKNICYIHNGKDKIQFDLQ